MLKKVLLIMALASPAMADTGFTSTIKLLDKNTPVSCVAGQINVSQGTLSCSGQVATLTTGGGSNVTLCGTGNNGIQFIDTASCKWCQTVNTSGSIVTALISCPATGFILMEDGTFILQEDGTKILVN